MKIAGEHAVYKELSFRFFLFYVVIEVFVVLKTCFGIYIICYINKNKIDLYERLELTCRIIVKLQFFPRRICSDSLMLSKNLVVTCFKIGKKKNPTNMPRGIPQNSQGA